MRTAELKQDLGKSFQRELEYDPQHLYKQLDNEKANHVTSVSRPEGDIVKIDKDLLAAEIRALKDRPTIESAEMDKERKARAKLQTEVKELTTSLKQRKDQLPKSPIDAGKGTDQAQTGEECCCSLPGQL